MNSEKNKVGKIYYGASDIAEMLGVSNTKAYEIIKSLNSELEEKGYIVLAGKVSVAYFNEKWYGGVKMTAAG